MAITVTGNRVTLSTPQGDASRANSDLTELAGLTPGALSTWFDSLTALRKQALVKALLVKQVELERRIKALENK